MLFFIICVLAIISLGILVTVRTKPVRAHAPMNAPVVEEPIEQPTPPTEIDLGVPNAPKFETSGQTVFTQDIDQSEDIVKNLKMSAKPKRKYNKKKGANTNQFKNKK